MRLHNKLTFLQPGGAAIGGQHRASRQRMSKTGVAESIPRTAYLICNERTTYEAGISRSHFSGSGPVLSLLRETKPVPFFDKTSQHAGERPAFSAIAAH